jgi:hypothetical protein
MSPTNRLNAANVMSHKKYAIVFKMLLYTKGLAISLKIKCSEISFPTFESIGENFSIFSKLLSKVLLWVPLELKIFMASFIAVLKRDLSK